jgi:polar amino acid transport system substrate-binding protein
MDADDRAAAVLAHARAAGRPSEPLVFPEFAKTDAGVLQSEEGNKMFRTGVLLLTATCLLALAQTANSEGLPARIQASKTLKVALNSGYPPLEMKDPQTNEFTGFDIDLAAAMAKVLGVKIEYQDGAFEQMTPSLQSARVDMIMSGFYDTPKRRPMFDFIDYLVAGAQFYTLQSLTELKTPVDLCGKTITTSRGTSYPETVKSWSDTNCVAVGKPPISVIVDTDLGQQLTNLKTGRAVAAVQGLEAVPAILEMEPGTLRPLGEHFSSALMGMAFNKSDTDLRDACLAALKKVIADGTYDALIKKWKLDLSTYKDATLNAGPQP